MTEEMTLNEFAGGCGVIMRAVVEAQAVCVLQGNPIVYPVFEVDVSNLGHEKRWEVWDQLNRTLYASDSFAFVYLFKRLCNDMEPVSCSKKC
jgi:hypothetical protein